MANIGTNNGDINPYPQFPMRHRLFYRRAKTGCLTCRRRRKKCDEIKPACTGCIRNSLQCSWPVDNTEKNTKVSESSKSSSSRREHRQECSPSQGLGSFGVVSLEGDETIQSPSTPSTPSTVALSTISSPSSFEPTTPSTLFKDTGHNISWDPKLELYISTNRESLLRPTSRLLLQHYLENTSALLAAKPLKKNPFVMHIMPIAYCDDLLMHAVLALSGTHLSFQRSTASEICRATWQHYALVISNLRREFNDIPIASPARSLRLLLILVVLCHVEAISGNCNGAIFAHLRASRQLILNLLASSNHKEDADSRSLQGFVLESYAYLVLVGNITPYGKVEHRTIPFDHFVTSLGPLQEYETFGTFFGCGYALFEMIAAISQFSTKRLSEEQEGQLSDESITTYENLLAGIKDWKSTPPDAEMADWASEHVYAGEIYRHALLIYLKTCMCGSVVNNPKIICEIQQHIDVFFELSPKLGISPYGTIMLWPSLITGSCIIKDDQRNCLQESFRLSRWSMSHVDQASNLLTLLWEDGDKCAFGPYGLHYIMEKYGINFCMA